MKRLFLPIICVFALNTGCTSDEGMLKEQAIDAGQIKFNELLEKESEENLKQSPVLQQSYIEFIKAHSEILAEEIKFQGENQAVVFVVLKTYPNKLRQTLLEVAEKVDSAKSRRFNFGEAAALISKQKGIKEEVESRPLVLLKFQKVSGQWKLENRE